MIKPIEKYPTFFQQKAFWYAITSLSCLVLAVTVIGLFWIGGIVLDYLQQVLLPIAVAGIIAYLLEPIVSWLERRKIKRTLSIGLVLIAFLGLMSLVFVTIIPPIVTQTNDIIKNREQIIDKTAQYFNKSLEHPIIERVVQSYYESSLKAKKEADATEGHWVGDAISSIVKGNDEKSTSVTALVKEDKEALTQAEILEAKSLGTQKMLVMAMENNSATYAKYLSSWFSSGREILSGGLGWIIGIILVPIFVFVFLKESTSIAERWTDILPIRTSAFKEEVVATLTEINQYLIAFFRGQMIVSLIDGTMIGVGLWFLGMPYAFIIGAAVGVLGIVPYIGIFVVFVPTLALSWFVWHDWQHIIWVPVIFLVCNQFDSWFIQPKIVGNAVGLHEVTVIFSVIFWSFLFGGIVGALLAVPLTASIKVIFQRYIWMNFQEKNLGARLHKSHESS